MHADVIVVGTRCEAYLAAYLFAYRGYRTLLLSPSAGALPPGQHLLLSADFAGRLKPVSPPNEVIRARSFTLELWSPEERQRVAVKQLPMLLIDEAAYCRYLESCAGRTRNFRIIRSQPPESLVIKNGVVTGIKVPSGDELTARVVIECDGAKAPLSSGLQAIWQMPSLTPFAGRFHAVRRQVGAAASAWEMGTSTVRIKAKEYATWHYRYAQDELEIACLVPPGSRSRPEPRVGKIYQEAGLMSTREVGSEDRKVHLGPPLPVPIGPGYLAAGAAAGHCNPFMPMDRTAALAGVVQAHLAASGAFEDARPGLAGHWEYVRSVATDWAARQAFVYRISAGLWQLSSDQLESVFKAGLVDTYFLSCLALTRVLEEDSLDSFSRILKALARPGVFLAWTGLLKKARKLANAYRAVPSRFNREGALEWQANVLKQWT